jgi:hypothetical protein
MSNTFAGAARAALAVVCALALQARAEEPNPAQSLLEKESPEIFLAKATLQQYLSRVVRKDWDGARRLTHPRALEQLERLKTRTGRELSNLAPWANRDAQLQAFRFTGARELLPGVIAVATGEDVFHTEEHGVSADDPALYILFLRDGTWLVGDKKGGMSLDDVTRESVQAGYPGWTEPEKKPLGRRAHRRSRQE